MNEITNVTIGCDPEFFIKHKITGEYVSSIGILGGSKESPKELTKEGHAVQEDNVLGEFNIPPSSSQAEFVENIQIAITAIKKDILPDNLLIDFKSSVYMPWPELLEDNAQIIGCDSDINAWNGLTNDAIDTLEYTNLRTGGGHIHIGYDSPKDKLSFELIKTLDLFLAVPGVLIDKDVERRSLYGKAGACRLKNYGVEFRTLSNFWLNSEELQKWAYDSTLKAIDFVNKGNRIVEEDGFMIQETIDDSDEAFAKILVEKYKLDVINIDYEGNTNRTTSQATSIR